MRVAVPATAHVRISRNRVDGLILLLMKGRGVTQRPEAFLTRALTVRLHAPDGGFWIEANSPETQWVDGPAGRDQENHVAWRWTVTPQESGRGRLHLVVTARTVGHDGAAIETSPPDRVIEVTVTGGQPGRLRWWAGVVLTLLLGAVIGRFGGEVWAIVSGIIRRLSG